MRQIAEQSQHEPLVFVRQLSAAVHQPLRQESVQQLNQTFPGHQCQQQ
jgi:hypothetical protein